MEQRRKRAAWVNWALFFGTMILVFFLGLLASSITERKAENEYVYKPKVKLSEYEPRNEIWGENFPRGHFYAIDDIRNNLRTGGPMKPDEGPMPNTCWTCKSPDVARLMADMGPAEFYKGKWASKGPEVVNYIGCADCHDPKTLDLRITRPALVEAFRAAGMDISQATHQEMRSLVCAQCHVEYYFDKSRQDALDVQYLTFPWRDGRTPEAMLAYYNEAGFSDFTHQLSKAPILKAQHPDYEIFITGIHAGRGLACADCHMPYVKEGGQKFTSHKMVSPLANIESTCQVCHRESEEQLRENVYERQEKVKEIRDKLEMQLVRAHVEAKEAWDAGVQEKEMELVLKHIRNAQWYWDFTAASHGGSFHSPVEMTRVVGLGMDETQQARVILARLLSKSGIGEVPYPDITTKTKAQEFIGLPMDKLRTEKAEFLKQIIPQWDQEAAAREEAWGVQYY